MIRPLQAGGWSTAQPTHGTLGFERFLVQASRLRRPPRRPPPAPSTTRTQESPVRRHRASAGVAVLALAAVVLAACTGDDDQVFGTAEVAEGEVVQTVAAAGVLEPAGRTTVTAPSAGEIEVLDVADGDRVESGDPLFTLRSDSLEQQLEQAEAAVETVGMLAGAPDGLASVDLAPVVTSLQAQLDAVVPALLGTLEDQVGALEATITAVTSATEESGRATVAALRDLRDTLGGALPEELGVDPETIAAPAAESTLVTVDTAELEASLASSQARLHTTQTEYRAATAQLDEVAASLSAQTEGAAEAQDAAVAAQREQAEAAVEAVRERIEDLAVVAPDSGVVELVRDAGGGDLGGLGALEGLEGLGDVGDLEGLGGELGELGELGDGLGGDAGDLDGVLGGEAGPNGAEGPAEVGARVGAGQPVLTIFDLDVFTVRAEVDELDVIEVAAGQEGVVLVDAFPTAELRGVVERVGIEPRQVGTGGAQFPVTVRIEEVPDDVDLRLGMTSSVEIEVRAVAGELVVPSSALLRRGGDEIIHVVRDGRAERVNVEVLALGDGVAAVEGPVEPGDVVVTTGVELLEDGQEIETEPDDDLAAAPPAAR